MRETAEGGRKKMMEDDACRIHFLNRFLDVVVVIAGHRDLAEESRWNC